MFIAEYIAKNNIKIKQPSKSLPKDFLNYEGDIKIIDDPTKHYKLMLEEDFEAFAESHKVLRYNKYINAHLILAEYED